MKRFSKNKHNTKVEKLVYDDNSQDVILYKGLPIISRKTTNIKTDDDKVHICKNQIFKVKIMDISIILNHENPLMVQL